MPFDFLAFIKNERISYITEGKNVKRGNFNITCPFCGASDKHYHMGIDPKTGYWGCWRNPFHRGTRPTRLIAALKGCTWEEAEAIASDELLAESVGLPGLKERVNTLFGTPPKRSKLKVYDFDPSFKPIRDRGTTSRFWQYLIRRKFDPQDIEQLCSDYSLRCSLVGEWAYRLILPFVVNEEIVGWQGRAITPSSLRYRSFPGSEDVKRLVFNHDAALQGGRVLVIVEGPLDALKIDFYGKDAGIRAIGGLGVSMTSAQVAIILKLARRFDDVALMLDPDALGVALRLQGVLSPARPKLIQIPDRFEDPGDFTPDAVVPVIEEAIYGDPLARK